MAPPSPRGRPIRKSSLLSLDDAHHHYPLTTRTGALASLIRSRSQQSLTGSWPPAAHRHVPDDDESAIWMRHDDEDIERLLRDETRLSQILKGPQVRSMNLIGKSNPRYRWERYWKNEDELKAMKKPIREYYERTNELIQQYMYIDCLLDSSIPHDLLNEYSAELEASAFRPLDVPATISEEPNLSQSLSTASLDRQGPDSYGSIAPAPKDNGQNGAKPPLPQKRTPKDIFRSSESMPLLQHADEEPFSPAPVPRTGDKGPRPSLSWLEDGEVDSDDPIVTLAIWVNLVANVVLLIGKIAVIISVPSMSVLASLVDATLDFLSTAIVWTTTRLISSGHKDQHRYPVGRRRLEPVGVLVFSVIMVTSFVQVGLQCIQRLAGTEHEIISLGLPAIVIMVTTIVIKGACWVWCRLVKNSSVRALADDAKTDVIFNIGSILFPIIGFYGKIWWLDASGGLVLSLVVIFTWSQTSAHHVRNLTGFSAQPDERNLLLYLTMRFATAIRRIQNLRAYHAGDKLFVEVDIVLSAITPLKDSHDLSEVLTYFLESVPIVDRAFVHVDYASYNAPTHMLKQSSS
ncbi:cation efflux family protein [Hirsutella rhossiliensis]|uniref:Cation efflux family domain-containing protein n=1 Tax=Hirsutella rhossiliensis TaxID=111463 RepID=A0A9P8MLZ6_9HYPO|nr:cation efflux family domain-containing protein [Hirsutella rhossiliensis]KAH0957474.1 cation efflux family domain-containing protein [Hirsutella rhossiliensis]